MKNPELLSAFMHLLNSFPNAGMIDKIDLVLAKLEEIDISKKEEEDFEFLQINEVCKLTRKSRVTIWNWNRTGKLKCAGKSGKNPLYKKKDVFDFIHKSGTV